MTIEKNKNSYFEFSDDIQSGQTTDYEWDSSDLKDNCAEHWKKRLISKFNDKM